MKTCKEYRNQAANTLKGKGGIFAVVTLVYLLVAGFGGVFNLIPFIGWLFYLAIFLCVSLPLCYSFMLIFRHEADGKTVNEPLNELFGCFKNFERSFRVMGRMMLFVFLWSLLFWIPGIIKGLAYSMAVYISEDHPEYTAKQCLDASQDMMKGYKGKLFCLMLSYIGWLILCGLTFGILSLWVTPKMQTASAHFYQDLKQEKGAAVNA